MQDLLQRNTLLFATQFWENAIFRSISKIVCSLLAYLYSTCSNHPWLRDIAEFIVTSENNSESWDLVNLDVFGI